MQQFQIESFIDQFTEFPLPIETVEERLSWMRGWMSWRSVRLDEFPFRHVQTEEQERLLKTSFLGTLDTREASNIKAAVRGTYADLETKLSLISVITNEGFVIISVHPFVPVIEKKSWAANFIERRYWRMYWNAARETVLQPDSSGKPTGSMNVTRRLIAEIKNEGYPDKLFELLGDIREETIIRSAMVFKITDIEENWKVGYRTFLKLGDFEKGALIRACDLYRASRLNRDVYSRYVIVWTALDSSTPFVNEKNGELKIKGMSDFIGMISGVKDTLEALRKLRKTRNDIAHNHSVNPSQCKTYLIQLEWLFQCFIRKNLGLRELSQNLTPFT